MTDNLRRILNDVELVQWRIRRAPTWTLGWLWFATPTVRLVVELTYGGF